MTSLWRYTVTLVDERALRTVLNFMSEQDGIGLSEEFDSLMIDAAALLSDLLAVSDALLYSETATYLMGGDTALPADADISDEAAIVCFLSAAAAVPKYHVLRIPAPIDALFESDGVTVDESNAALIAYIDNFDTAFQVSDGEPVIVANENGISHGFWRSRAKKGAKKLS